jgi:hypothetical protein
VWEDLTRRSRAVYVRRREAGRHRDRAWLIGPAIARELPAWVDAATGPRATLELTQVDAAAVARPVGRRLLADHERGLWAFSDDPADPKCWLAPNEIIASNRRHPKALEHRFGSDAWRQGRVFAFATRQWLYTPGAGPEWVALDRQKAPAGERRVDHTGLAALRDGLAGWLYAGTERHGCPPYKYWPGNGRYSPADNSIRRFFGAFAMRQHAWRSGDATRRRLADRCLMRLLDERFRCDGDGRGLVVDRHGVKLGAIAVAGLAALAAPARLADLTEALYRTTRALARRDGAFRTFWWPDDRNDNQNFYPGEALYFWACLYRRNHDADLRQSIDRALHYYQRWHRDRPNPAFVPWHTLALSVMFGTTGNRGYLDDVASMNRWLLPIQQWEQTPHPDLRGRFFDPGRPDFGPPHASSTAVYCESLATAAGVLRQAGDRRTSERLARAALRGLGHLRQLQYLDRTDLFRFAHPERVRGAVRTEVYDLTVRVDSVAHALQACLAWEAAGLPFPDQEQSPS